MLCVAGRQPLHRWRSGRHGNRPGSRTMLTLAAAASAPESASYSGMPPHGMILSQVPDTRFCTLRQSPGRTPSHLHPRRRLRRPVRGNSPGEPPLAQQQAAAGKYCLWSMPASVCWGNIWCTSVLQAACAWPAAAYLFPLAAACMACSFFRSNPLCAVAVARCMPCRCRSPS